MWRGGFNCFASERVNQSLGATFLFLYISLRLSHNVINFTIKLRGKSRLLFIWVFSMFRATILQVMQIIIIIFLQFKRVRTKNIVPCWHLFCQRSFHIGWDFLKVVWTVFLDLLQDKSPQDSVIINYSPSFHNYPYLPFSLQCLYWHSLH